MPFVEYDELPEGFEAADVVPRADYDAVIAERDQVIEQRDGAISRAQVAEDEARKAKAKYADAFLTTASRVKEMHRRDVKSEGRPHTFSELFSTHDRTA